MDGSAMEIRLNMALELLGKPLVGHKFVERHDGLALMSRCGMMPPSCLTPRSTGKSWLLATLRDGVLIPLGELMPEPEEKDEVPRTPAQC